MPKGDAGHTLETPMWTAHRTRHHQSWPVGWNLPRYPIADQWWRD